MDWLLPEPQFVDEIIGKPGGPMAGRDTSKASAGRKPPLNERLPPAEAFTSLPVVENLG